MTLADRISYLSTILEELQNTNSRLEKLDIVNSIDKDFKEDFDYIVECLAGKHKFGYKFYNTYCFTDYDGVMLNMTITQVLQYLQEPISQQNLTEVNIRDHLCKVQLWSNFFEPIVNRTLKIGIGNSLIDKTNTSPMLAKKYEGDILNSYSGYFVTQKLDGNRCIAIYYDDQWHFVSRNGKPMHVNFSMTGFDTSYIYDGEVLSRSQTQHAIDVALRCATYSDNTFNETSGLINRHNVNKDLVYNIFDIIDTNLSYFERRKILNGVAIDNVGAPPKDVIVLPLLTYFEKQIDENELFALLDYVTNTGGEGLMINVGDAKYVQKRTNTLLKVKKTKTIDMKVLDICEGVGKYEGLVGSLYCKATTDDGKIIYCNVGSGLSDEQRLKWMLKSFDIVNKIIEVEYFEISQPKDWIGSNHYSLRFPRLKRVRVDKDTTSEY